MKSHPSISPHPTSWLGNPVPVRRRDTSSLHSAQKLCAFFLTLFILPVTSLAEELPRKAPLSKYTGLWTNSPFTSRPVVATPEAAPEINPFEDYSLIGVSPSHDGFLVTLINRNDPTDRIIIDSGRPNPRHDFEVLDIDRKPGRPLDTTVRLSKGSSVGTVGFESAMLTLTPPPAAAPQQPNPVPGINPGDAQPEQAQGVRRQPRPRVVPPPANAQQPANPRGANPQGARGQRGTQGASRERSDRRGRR